MLSCLCLLLCYGGCGMSETKRELRKNFHDLLMNSFTKFFSAEMAHSFDQQDARFLADKIDRMKKWLKSFWRQTEGHEVEGVI